MTVFYYTAITYLLLQEQAGSARQICESMGYFNYYCDSYNCNYQGIYGGCHCCRLDSEWHCVNDTSMFDCESTNTLDGTYEDRTYRYPEQEPEVDHGSIRLIIGIVSAVLALLGLLCWIRRYRNSSRTTQWSNRRNASRMAGLVVMTPLSTNNDRAREDENRTNNEQGCPMASQDCNGSTTVEMTPPPAYSECTVPMTTTKM